MNLRFPSATGEHWGLSIQCGVWLVSWFYQQTFHISRSILIGHYLLNLPKLSLWAFSMLYQTHLIVSGIHRVHKDFTWVFTRSLYYGVKHMRSGSRSDFRDAKRLNRWAWILDRMRIWACGFFHGEFCIGFWAIYFTPKAGMCDSKPQLSGRTLSGYWIRG